jgi:hypothetical protein
VTSIQAITLGSVLSKIGNTTRNRDQASQAQNSVVVRPPIVGPSPKSYWNQYAADANMRRRPGNGHVVAAQGGWKIF